MRSGRGVLVGVAVVALAASMGPVPGEAAAPPAGRAAPAPAPLVADAGASPAVVVGSDAVVLAAGWGGTEPYTFAWETSAGTVRTTTNPATGIDTSEVEPGIHTATVTVTDQAGDTATDEVRFVVVAPAEPGEVEGELDGEELSELLVTLLVGSGEGEDGDAPDPTAGLTPRADAGGPYEFGLDDTPQLRGTVDGGRGPYTTGWDLDLDGRVDVAGDTVTPELDRGHHLVRYLVTDADGLTHQQMTSVIVGTDDEIRDATIPLVVIGQSDSGINPYHQEFAASSYPDDAVLRLTQDFTRHPSEYLDGFPEDAVALPISTDAGYYPEQDRWIFHREIDEASPDPLELLATSTFHHGLAQPGQLYWIPGTKIIGALGFNGYGGLGEGPDRDLILDGNGHGTGSGSVAVGNRYGYCPSCLLFIVEGLVHDPVHGAPFVDITSHSHGYVGGLPMGLLYTALEPLLGDPTEGTREAAERGVTVLFSSGNGIGNAFDLPNPTIVSDMTGPTWTLDVGALRRDTGGAIVGDGTPAHISSWGDGFLPSACRSGTVDQCMFSGTSAAAPYTAGVFGHVLREIRAVLGDGRNAPRGGQVIAEGRPVPDSPYLADGTLTRAEFREVMLKTAAPLPGEFSPFVYPVNLPLDVGRFLVEGYGAASPNHAERAIAVLLGEAELPDRAETDRFFGVDCELRDAVYGSWDRTGDGEVDGCDADAWGPSSAGSGPVTAGPPVEDRFEAARPAIADDPALTEPFTYHLHRDPAHEPWRGSPACGAPQSATAGDMEHRLSRAPAEGTSPVCFDSAITGAIAGYRPKGVYAADDVLAGTLPAGSTAEVHAHVQVLAAAPLVMEAHLVAGDRIIGSSAPVTSLAVQGSWTEVELSLTTDRPAVRGEPLSLHFTLAGAAEWAYGHGEDAPSRITITPGVPGPGGQFGVTIDEVVTADGATVVTGRAAVPDLGPDPDAAGFQPVVAQVQVAVDDERFHAASFATLDRTGGTWRAVLPAVEAGLPVHARVLRDTVPSATVTVAAPETAAATPTPTPTSTPAPVAAAGPPTSAPLPVTGSGLGLAGLLALAAWTVDRSRRHRRTPTAAGARRAA